MLPGCTLSSLPSGLPFSTQPKAKAFSKQSGCFQTTGAPSFFVSVSFTLIFFLTISFSELLHQVPIKSHLWHFISRTSRFCVLALSLLQKSGSRTDISQATLLLNLRRLPCPSLFTSRQQSFMPQTRSLYNFFKAIIVPCDEISQKMKLSNTLTCCHLLFVCAVPFILQRVISVALSSTLQKTQMHVLKSFSHSLEDLALALNTVTLQQNIFISLHFADNLEKTFNSLCFQGRAGGGYWDSRSFCPLPISVIILRDI